MEAQKSKIIYFKSQASGKAMNSAIAALALSKAAHTVSQIVEKSDVKRACPKCICQWFSNQNPTSRLHQDKERRCSLVPNSVGAHITFSKDALAVCSGSRTGQARCSIECTYLWVESRDLSFHSINWLQFP